MKKDLIKKIVDTAASTTFWKIHNCAKVAVDFDIAVKYGLSASVSNVFTYIELRETGYKEDLIISFTEYDNAINLWRTVHSKTDGKTLGYKYITYVTTGKKNQIEVTAELMNCIFMARNECKY